MAEAVIELHIINPDHRTVCLREVQKSLKFSVKQLLEDKIKALGVGHLFDVQSAEIRNINGSGVIIFQGMQDHTAESVKSLEGFDLAYCEEAQSFSARSISLLDPTMRKPGCELWFSWNPSLEDDAVEVLFKDNEDAVLVHVNYDDNPFCPQSMIDLAKREKRRDIDKFNHVWLGQYVNMSESQVFKNWTKGILDPPDNVVWFYGADWGFSVDPNAVLRACVMGEVLYVDSMAYEVGTPTESLPQLIGTVTDAAKWPMRADNARPETIDYVRRHGFPKIRGAKKGKGSVEAGINFLQGFDIVVHPDCAPLLRELRLYSYKTDKQTGEVLPAIVDANNHAIDALRYAVEGLHKKGTRIKDEAEGRRRRSYDYGVDDEEEMDLWKIV